METLMLMGTIGAVLWLAAWSVRDPGASSRWWWPFDTRDDTGPELKGPAPKRASRRADRVAARRRAP